MFLKSDFNSKYGIKDFCRETGGGFIMTQIVSEDGTHYAESNHYGSKTVIIITQKNARIMHSSGHTVFAIFSPPSNDYNVTITKSHFGRRNQRNGASNHYFQSVITP